MLMLEITLFVLAIIILYFTFQNVKEIVARFITMQKLPGPSGRNILIGNFYYLGHTPDDIFKMLRKLAVTYYPIYKLYALYETGANIVNPEDCELILSNPKHNEKSIVYQLLHGWFGTGLLTSSGEKWLTRRRILTPAFHFSILQQFVNIFNEETQCLVKTFNEDCLKPFVNINSHVTQFTLKTIAETAMGTKLKFNTKKELDYKQAVLDMGDIVVYKFLHPWLILKFTNLLSSKYFLERKTTKILHQFTKDVISERQKTVQNIILPTEEHEVYKGKRRLAMLDLLILAKNKEGVIDDEGIREEVDTFMFEGHDTTSMALSFALMLIACNKHVQNQIVEEIYKVLGDPHKKPTYNDLQEMKYLERAIKEVLRLYPSVFFISRKLGEDVMSNSGYLLPKNSIVVVHIYDIHHNPNIYPDPERFDPDRFLPENCKNRHPFAYLPFSAGPRNCIGQKFAMLELKAALCGVLANFLLEPVDTPSTVVLMADIIIRTKDPIKVKFVPRKL